MDQAAQELITRHNEQMRELIVRDIDALEDKLNVKRQVSIKADEALDKVKGTLGMNQRNQDEGWASFMRHNAAPLAAVGLGGAVLAKNLRDRTTSSDSQTTTTRLVSESAYVAYPASDEGSDGGGLKERATAKVSDVQSAASDGMGTAKEKVTDVADTTKAKVSDAKDIAKAKASDAKETAKAKASDAKETVVDGVSTARTAVSEQAVHAKDVVVERIPSREQASRAAHDHSQLLGLAALAAGAVAGTFVPRTRAEERRLAPVQGQVKDKASELVEGTVDKAKETADRAAEAISAGADTAKEEFADSGEEPPSGDTSSTELPGITRSNRITGARMGATTGAGGSSSS